MSKQLLQIVCFAIALCCLPICFFLDAKHSLSEAGIPSGKFAGLGARAKIFLIGVAAILAMVELYIF